jgi:hypothetical protein
MAQPIAERGKRLLVVGVFHLECPCAAAAQALKALKRSETKKQATPTFFFEALQLIHDPQGTFPSQRWIIPWTRPSGPNDDDRWRRLCGEALYQAAFHQDGSL